MKRLAAALTLFLALLGLVLGACGSGEGGPLESTPFRSEELGYTIRYPEGWQYNGAYGEVVFYESEDVLGEGFGSAPIVLIMGGLVEEMPFGSGPVPENARDIVDAFIEDVPSDFDVGKVQDTPVGEENGACVDLSGEEEGKNVTGRVCAAISGVRGFVIVAYSPTEAWGGFKSTFDAMLGSMTFFEP
jgi:hypothetical protein